MVARFIAAFVLLAGLLLLCGMAVEPQDIEVRADSALNVLALDAAAYQEAAGEAYQAGDYGEAARNYLAALHIDNSNSDHIYNLACCYSLLDEPALALEALEAAIDAGFDDTWMIREDPDFDGMKETAEFTELLERKEEEVAAASEDLGQLVFFKSETYLRGRAFYPENYDPAGRYRLIVALHGFGHHAEGFATLNQRFNKDGNELIFVALQAPYAWNSGMEEPGYSWGWGTGQYGLPAGSWATSEDYVASAIEQLQMSHNISETYLMGFSQGAFMTLSTGIRNHNLLTGLMPFGGGIEPANLTASEVEAGNGLRVFIGHGGSDTVVPTEEGIAAYDTLVEAGFDATYYEFEGGHRVPEELTDAALEWIISYSAEEHMEE